MLLTGHRGAPVEPVAGPGPWVSSTVPGHHAGSGRRRELGFVHPLGYSDAVRRASRTGCGSRSGHGLRTADEALIVGGSVAAQGGVDCAAVRSIARSSPLWTAVPGRTCAPPFGVGHGRISPICSFIHPWALRQAHEIWAGHDEAGRGRFTFLGGHRGAVRVGIGTWAVRFVATRSRYPLRGGGGGRGG